MIGRSSYQNEVVLRTGTMAFVPCNECAAVPGGHLTRPLVGSIRERDLLYSGGLQRLPWHPAHAPRPHYGSAHVAAAASGSRLEISPRDLHGLVRHGGGTRVQIGLVDDAL